MYECLLISTYKIVLFKIGWHILKEIFFSYDPKISLFNVAAVFIWMKADFEVDLLAEYIAIPNHSIRSGILILKLPVRTRLRERGNMAVSFWSPSDIIPSPYCYVIKINY